jgi:hypothetical protein
MNSRRHPFLFALLPLAPWLAAQEVKIPRPPQERAAKTAPLPVDKHTLVPTELPSAAAVLPSAADTGALAGNAAAAMPAAVLDAFADRSQVWFDRPQPDDLWCHGADWKAQVGPDAFTYIPFFGSDAPQNYPLRLAFAAATAGGEPLATTPGRLQQHGRRIDIDRGGLTEQWTLAGERVQHAFRIDALPQRGALDIAIAVATELHAEPTPAGVRFHNASGAVTYETGEAIDARGRRTSFVPVFEAGHLRLRIPAAFVAAAELPILVDPLLTTVVLANVQTTLTDADLSYDATTAVWVVTWTRYFSAADHDIWYRRLDANLQPLASADTIDYTSSSWDGARIANNNLADNFLVVAQAATSFGAVPAWIGGRLVDPLLGAAANLQFDVYRGPAGSLGELLPDVGGDPYLVGPTYYTVVWEHVYSATDHDIWMRQVEANGTPRGAAPVVLDGSTDNESKPQISRSNGPGPSPEQRWLVAYQRTYSPTDEDIRGALLTWDGLSVPVGGQFHFSIDGSSRNHVDPSPSSPTNEPVRRFMIAYAWIQTAQSIGDIDARVIRSDGTLSTARYGIEGSPALRQALPSCDSDGRRFVVAFGQYPSAPGSNPDVYYGTYAADAAGSQLATIETPVPVSATVWSEFDARVASTYASSGQWSPTYGIAIAAAFFPSFDVAAHLVNGLAPGGVFMRQNGCGGLAVVPPGFAAIGTPVRFDVVSAQPLVGFAVGAAVSLPIGPCPGCTLGADGSLLLGGTLQFDLPLQPALIGAGLSVQGFEWNAGPCLGHISLSNTYDLIVQ